MGVRILFIDDMADDVELMLGRLRSAGIDAEWRRVAGEAELREALADGVWDLVVSDYSLPGFSGPAAIRMVGEAAPGTPVITVSGTIDENTAVATLTAGAADYVLKDNLTRLAPAVERAIAGAEAKRLQRRQAEEARMLRHALDDASFPVSMLTEDGTFVYANQSRLELTGHRREEFIGAKIWECDPGTSVEEWTGYWREVRGKGVIEIVHTLRDAHGDERIVDVTLDYLEREGAPPVAVAYSHDVTEGRRAQEALRESEARLEAFGFRMPGYLFMLDGDHRYIYVNEYEAPADQLTAKDWLGKTPTDLWPPEEAASEEDAVGRALAGEVVEALEDSSNPIPGEHLHSVYFPIHREGKPTLVGGVSVNVNALIEAQQEIEKSAEQLRLTLEGAVMAMGQVVETRDPYTAGHERRVAELALAIAREMGIDGNTRDGLRIAAVIHDIGKIAVPAEILTKPGRLTDTEFMLIQQHAKVGYDILSGVRFQQPVAELVLQHHERLDGSGYPRHLQADSILPEARILAVADVVEAMSSHRPYRAALGMEAALDEIRAGAGFRYDPDVAAACERVIHDRGFEFTF